MTGVWAHGAREAGYFLWINLFCRDGSNEVSHAHGRGLEVRLVPQAGRQAGTQGRRQGGRQGRRDAGRDPDREDGHYADIYIDKFPLAVGL